MPRRCSEGRDERLARPIPNQRTREPRVPTSVGKFQTGADASRAPMARIRAVASFSPLMRRLAQQRVRPRAHRLGTLSFGPGVGSDLCLGAIFTAFLLGRPRTFSGLRHGRSNRNAVKMAPRQRPSPTARSIVEKQKDVGISRNDAVENALRMRWSRFVQGARASRPCCRVVSDGHYRLSSSMGWPRPDR